MNATIENFQETDKELKELLEDIESVKSTIDLFAKVIDEKLFAAI